MKITPRKEEVKAVTAILESDEYANSTDMAKAIIKAVADSFAQREWYSFVWRMNAAAPLMAWGPLTSETEIGKFAKTLAIGGEGFGLKLCSTQATLDRLAEYGTEYGAGMLCSCGHYKGVHEHPKMGTACAIVGCPCKRYEKQSKAA